MTFDTKFLKINCLELTIQITLFYFISYFSLKKKQLFIVVFVPYKKPFLD